MKEENSASQVASPVRLEPKIQSRIPEDLSSRDIIVIEDLNSPALLETAQNYGNHG
jgi:hypothetical protein